MPDSLAGFAYGAAKGMICRERGKTAHDLPNLAFRSAVFRS
jgi:hypothetical protein